MWLIICHNSDVPSRWLFQALRKSGVDGIELVSAEALPYALRWKHHLSSDSIDVEFEFHGGRRYCSRGIDGVINRINYVNPEVWHNSQGGDRDYVVQELTAFYASWLSSLECPIYNPPDPLCLSGKARRTSQWAILASKAGLTVPIYHSSSLICDDSNKGKMLVMDSWGTQSVLILDDEVVGPVPIAAVREGCLTLASLSGCRFLNIEFAVDNNQEWAFASANPVPDFRMGGMTIVWKFAQRMRRV